ncbi:MAG: tetratricopeptide repeat protein [Gemmatimonadota bacterium]|nr:tetratricopeptide repeat protein [Gemmatimonadota bacterium]
MAEFLPEKSNKPRLLLLLLLAAALALYLPSLENGYVGWDDELILNNELIQSLSPGNLVRLVPLAAGKGEIVTTQPLRTLSHALVYAVSGSRPFGYMAFNILLFLVNAALFFFLVRTLVRAHGSGRLRERADWVALAAAAAFVVHPVNVEVVSWLQGGKMSLMGAFFIGSFILYVRYRLNGGRVFLYWSSVALCWAALGSQPGAVALPLVLASYDFLFHRPAKDRDQGGKWWGRLALSMLPYLLPGLLVGAYLYFNTSLSQLTGESTPFMARIFTVPLLWLKYLLKFFLPVNLCCRYPMAVPMEAQVLKGLSAGILLAGAGIAAWGATGFSRLGVLALAWFAATALPTAGLVPTSTLMADRYMFLPGQGLFLQLALGAGALIPPCGPGSGTKALLRCWLKVLVPALVLVCWSTVTVHRQADWRNAISLWTRVVKIYPGHSLGHFNLADALQQSGNLEQAIDHYSRAIRTNPEYSKAYNNLGVCLRLRGEDLDALGAFEQARRLDPGRGEVWVNLGISYARLGRDSLALAAFDKGAALGRRAGRTVYLNRAGLLLKMGRLKEALADLDTAVSRYPQYITTQGWLNIGDMLARASLVEQAVGLLSRGTRCAGFDAGCRRMLARLQIAAGKPEDALAVLEGAAREGPDSAGIVEHTVLVGIASQQAGLLAEAAVAYREALARKKTGRAGLLNNLGHALAGTGDLAGAEEAFIEALAEQPGYIEAGTGLGMLYVRLGRKEEAGRQLAQVIELCGPRQEYRAIAGRARELLDSLEINDISPVKR